MSLLNTQIKKRLLPGKYPMKIKHYEEFTNDKGGYLQIVLVLPDREIKQNFFQSNLDYLGKTLRDQLSLENEDMDLEEILKKAKGKEIFGVVSYNEYGLNIALHEQPIVEEKDVDFE